MFRVTQAWLEQFSTKEGGWTRDQLEQIGVPWPPRQGWKRRAVGMVITAEARKRFELRLSKKQAKRYLRSEKAQSAAQAAEGLTQLDAEFRDIVGRSE